MGPIGFSTGAVARGEFELAIEVIKRLDLRAVELSALRETEVRELIRNLDSLPLGTFDFISFHAPSKLSNISEYELVSLLVEIAERGWPVVVHPDIVDDWAEWQKLGQSLCIENMDKRKPIGRNVAELSIIFEKAPDALFCLDLGHSHQCDATMFEAMGMIDAFKDRLSHLHLSQVNTNSRHESVSYTALTAFRKVVEFLPLDIPVILEAMVDKSEAEMLAQIRVSEFLFDKVPV